MHNVKPPCYHIDHLPFKKSIGLTLLPQPTQYPDFPHRVPRSNLVSTPDLSIYTSQSHRTNAPEYHVHSYFHLSQPLGLSQNPHYLQLSQAPHPFCVAFNPLYSVRATPTCQLWSIPYTRAVPNVQVNSFPTSRPSPPAYPLLFPKLLYSQENSE